MNSALLYLLGTRLKNQVKSFLKKPARLIYVLIIAGLLTLTIFSGHADETPGPYRNLDELKGILIVFYAAMFILTAQSGFQAGGAFFRMADVNLIFPAPIHSRQALFYALIQQLGSSLLLGFFLLFQYSWLHSLYGISYGQLLLIVLGYALSLFCGQLCAMLLYAFTHGRENRLRWARGLFYGIILLFAVYAVGRLVLHRADWIVEATALGMSLPLRLFPVAGWIGAGIAALFDGALPYGLLGTLLFVGALVLLLLKSDPDYYEDVLQTAEKAQNAITAQKEGRVGDTAPQRVKLGKTGLQGGAGASAFYYKHCIENRRSRIFIVDTVSLIYIAVSLGFAFFVRGGGLVGAFAFSSYMQLFSAALGRLPKELTKPYIYLVPEPSYKKLLHCLREALPRNVLEAVLIFVPMAFILGLTPWEVAACILARLSFALLFTAGNLVVERVFGTTTSKVLTFFFYFLVLLLCALPGIVLALLLTIANVVLLSPNVTLALALTVCNLPVALLLLFLCRNMLEYAELNQ